MNSKFDIFLCFFMAIQFSGCRAQSQDDRFVKMMRSIVDDQCSAVHTLSASLDKASNALDTADALNKCSDNFETISGRLQSFVNEMEQWDKTKAPNFESSPEFKALVEQRKRLGADVATIVSALNHIESKYGSSPSVLKAIQRFRKSMGIIGRK